jgi:excisionase family DNA binding protein
MSVEGIEIAGEAVDAVLKGAVGRGSTCETVEVLLTVGEVARVLGVHENYVYDLAVRNVLPSFKIGGMRRFRPSELNRWLESQRSESAAGTDSARVGR